MGRSKASRHAPEKVDAYLVSLPADIRASLERLRATIREVAPEATERVSYGIPVFRLNKNLVGISAQKNHCSLHTMSPPLVQAMAEELQDYPISGATLHFSPNVPLPTELIVTILERRMRDLGMTKQS